MKNRIRSAWVFLMVGLLIFFMAWYQLATGPNKEEILIEFALLTMLLTLPVGYLVYVLVGIFSWFTGIEVDNVFAVVTVWIFSFILGYYQWFVLMPLIKHKIWGGK